MKSGIGQTTVSGWIWFEVVQLFEPRLISNYANSNLAKFDFLQQISILKQFTSIHDSIQLRWSSIAFPSGKIRERKNLSNLIQRTFFISRVSSKLLDKCRRCLAFSVETMHERFIYWISQTNFACWTKTLISTCAADDFVIAVSNEKSF